MFLTKFKPSAFDSFFDTGFFPVLRSPLAEEEAVRLPLTDVSETDEGFVVTMEMPGVDKSDVSVAVENEQLIVSGGKTEKNETKDADAGILRKEIRSARFHRTFRITSAIDRDNIKAKLESGVLTLTLPKVEKAVGRKIEIA